MKVVADCVVVGEEFQVRRVSLVHVVELHRGPAFARDEIVEPSRLRIAIRARSNGYLHPWKQVGQTSAWIIFSGVVHVAIELLPHLIKPMHWTACIVVILHSRRKLENAVGKIVHVRNAGINLAAGNSRGAGRQKFVVVVGQESRLKSFCNRDARSKLRRT